MSYKTHRPVLLQEVIKYLNPKPNENFIDATVGDGGHALEILKYTFPAGRVLGIDWDETAIKNLKGVGSNGIKGEKGEGQKGKGEEREQKGEKGGEEKRGEKKGGSPSSSATSGLLGIIRFGLDTGSNAWEAEPPRTYSRSGIEPRSYPLIGSRLVLKQGNFAEIKELSRLNLDRVDGVLFDLGLRTELIEGGVASNAIQGEEKGQKGQGDQRGFSFMKDGPLDMRFDRSQSLTAREIVNGWPEEKLADIFENLGEERNYKKIARAIAAARGKNRIETTGELVAVIKEVIASNAIKTLARVFQALRMAVNSELENLKAGLEGAWDIVLPQGRIAVISFHSLEDRVVKNFFKEKQVIGTGETLTKKPVRPSAEEIRVNSRSRSAKLRAIIKK